MLSPDEIRVKEFLPSLRGYDAEEVRAFLIAIAEAMEDLQERAHLGKGRATQAALSLPPSDAQLASKVTRLSEELEVAIWSMRRLEAVVERLEERLDSGGSAAAFLAS